MGGARSTKGERRGVFRLWWGTLRKRDYFEYQDIDGRIILRLIFKKWDERRGLD
jgi:hypothetical protein